MREGTGGKGANRARKKERTPKIRRPQNERSTGEEDRRPKVQKS